MSFFELPPKTEHHAFEPTATHQWTGPACNELGVELPFHLVLGESEAALIRLQSVTAYEHGLVFNLAARSKWKREPVKRDPVDFTHLFNRADHMPRSPTFVRFGLQFRDGSKVTNLTHPPDPFFDDAFQPDQPILIGDPNLYRYDSDGAVDLNYWLWPLPPGDTLQVVVEWPAEGITETATDIATTSLLDAAKTDTRF